MSIKLCEHTNGPHIYMRLRLNNNRIEEIDAYITENGWIYRTSADNNPDFPKPEIRSQIINAFHELYWPERPTESAAAGASSATRYPGGRSEEIKP